MDRILRLAVRGIILIDNRLLLVNAFATHPDFLWCLPGGGVEPGASLHDNLKREVLEETGLTISVGRPALINEFHNPNTGFHQVETVFSCTVTAGEFDPDWQDLEGVVSKQRLFERGELTNIPLKPDRMKSLPWESAPLAYDPLEIMAMPRV